MSQCWAYGPEMKRCELDGGHDGRHLVTNAWEDEESLTFDGGVAVMEATPIRTATLVDQAMPEVADMGEATSPGGCFMCGCSQAAHETDLGGGETGCPKHQCRQWLG